MKNSKVYCLISVCSCFVKILNVYIFFYGYELARGGDNGMVGRLLYRCQAI